MVLTVGELQALELLAHCNSEHKIADLFTYELCILVA
jgi:hypothetical protein